MPVGTLDSQMPGTLRPLAAEEASARQIQVGQSPGHKESIGILIQAAIADFGEAEYALDDTHRVLDLSLNPRLGAVLAAHDLLDDTLMAAAVIGEIPGVRRAGPDYLGLPTIGLIKRRLVNAAAPIFLI